MSSIIQILRRIGGAKAAPTSGSAGQLALWKSGTAATDNASLYAHDGTQWAEILDTAASWKLNGANVHWSAGDVGIGVNPPLHKLDVAGDGAFTGTVKMGSSFQRNLIINGNFLINQRNYAGVATKAANEYTRDRWRVVVSGQALAGASNGIDYTATAPAGGIEQVIEGVNIVGGTYVLSWTGTATATVNGAAVLNGKTVTLPASTDATVRFSGGTVSLVQLEQGALATPYERRPHPTEMLLCRRYFEMIASFQYFTAYAIGSNMIRGVIRFEVEKRVSPSILCSGQFKFNSNGVDYAIPIGNFSAINQSRDSAIFQGTGLTGMTGGYGGALVDHTASAIAVSAEF